MTLPLPLRSSRAGTRPRVAAPRSRVAVLRLLVAPVLVLGGIGSSFVLASPAAAGPATLYVAATGTNSGDCTDPANPCASVGYAVGQSSSGDTIEVSGTVVGPSKINTALTIAQEPGGLPAVLDGNGNRVAFVGPSGAVTFDQVTIEDGSANLGGGVDSDEGSISVIDSTVADNTATASGPDGGIGGGIDADGGSLSITESTFADNTAQSGGVGGIGGAIDDDDATVTITDSTFSDNSSQDGIGDAIDFDGGTTNLAGNLFGSPGGPVKGGNECGGFAPIDDGYNIDDDGSCGFSGPGSISDSNTIDDHLGPLEDNGGPTPTVALIEGPVTDPGDPAGPGDPALGAIPAGFVAHGQDSAVCSQPDQRGVARSQPCDMGSFEASTPPTTLYALPDGTASAPCTTESLTPASVCSLETALTQANGDSDRYVLDLESPSGDNDYTGPGAAGANETLSASMTVQADPDAGYDSAAPTLDGESNGTVFDIDGTYDVTVSGVTVQNGEAPFGSAGGGILNGGAGTLTVTGSTFVDNTGGGGGAVSNSDGGTLIVSDSTFTGNQSDGGGAIDNGTGGTGTGTLLVTDSTFVSNQANNYSGGAILNGYGSGDEGSAFISDSTFFKNSAPFDRGGAVDNGDNGGTGTLTVQSSTLIGSGAIENGDNSGTGTVTVEADMFGSFCGQASGSWIDDGYNVGIEGSCFNGSPSDVAAGKVLLGLLGPLEDNGGPTQTVLLAGRQSGDRDHPESHGRPVSDPGRPAGHRSPLPGFPVMPAPSRPASNRPSDRCPRLRRLRWSAVRRTPRPPRCRPASRS